MLHRFLVPASKLGDVPADLDVVLGVIADGKVARDPRIDTVETRLERASLVEGCDVQVFLEVWRKAARFDSSLGKAKTWVMTIAHRRAVDAVRRSESHRRQDHQAAPDEVGHDEPAEAVIAAEEEDQ